MKDKHLNKCKECNKRDAGLHRANNLEKIRAYDRARGCRAKAGYLKEYRERFPNKIKATTMVYKAIKDKKLFRKPCAECGSEDRIHGHHDDYLEPLNVRWLCAACHHQWHAKYGEGLNAT